MVKIPELPETYRPGDVVNGHVLTERGHWVPVDQPSDPADQPSAPADQSWAPANQPAPANRPPAAPGAPRTGPDPAPLPRVKASPSASRPAASHPGPRRRRSPARRVFLIVLVTFVVVRIIAAVANGVGAFGAAELDHGPLTDDVVVVLAGLGTAR